MDFGNSIPIISPKPCKYSKTPITQKALHNNQIINSINFEKFDKDNLCNIRSFDSQPSLRKFHGLLDFTDISFEKKIEENEINSELISIMNSNSTSTSITPDNDSSQSLQSNFFKSVGSYEVFSSDFYKIRPAPLTSCPMHIHNRPKNPFFKSLNDLQADLNHLTNKDELNIFDVLSKCKSTDFNKVSDINKSNNNR